MNQDRISQTLPQNAEIIYRYFPGLSAMQKAQLQALGDLYSYWNARINVISRKDITHLYEHHVLHSLAMAKIISFQDKSDILDLGTGGGFPGIPLAILFPKTRFYLLDSIQKKIKVVTHISQALNLKNVTPLCQRAELLHQTFDFILSRAVGSMAKLELWTGGKIKPKSVHSMKNGLLCWKGGKLANELKLLKLAHKIYPLIEIFSLPFFQDKAIVHLS